MDGNTKNLDYLCCFCNQVIKSTKVDPADINLQINIDKPKTQQYSQTFWCHVECFRSKLHDAMKMHFHLHNILDD